MKVRKLMQIISVLQSMIADPRDKFDLAVCFVDIAGNVGKIEEQDIKLIEIDPRTNRIADEITKKAGLGRKVIAIDLSNVVEKR